ncbi:MAG: SagB/ThcOx family dehydrogenase, partial [Anaerolineales bacterium]
MTMKSFTDPRAGVSGLKPGGWRTGPDVGLWVRASDHAMLLQRAIPNMTVDQIRRGLIPMFELPKLRECAGQHKTASFQWDLYHTNAEDAPDGLTTVDAALAQAGKWALMVLLVSKTAARQKLYEQVFLPALEALTPVYTGAEAVRVAKEQAQQYDEAVRSVRETMKCGLTVPTDWVSDQMKGLAMPPSQKACDPAAELIALPQPEKSVLKKPDILTCIADRKSRRKYSEADITLAELSYLLWATQGVRKAFPSWGTYRTVPSAGSRHSFETYLIIQHVEGLKTGVYRYLPLDHKLVHLFTAENLPEKMTALASDQPFVGNSAVCFIWSSIPYRMEWRYGLDSERVIL